MIGNAVPANFSKTLANAIKEQLFLLDLVLKQVEQNLRLVTLMRESKYLSFPTEDRERLESINNSSLQNRQIKIKSPNNPIKRIAARLIEYQT